MLFRSERWVPHLLKVGAQYRDDFLSLPIKRHVELLDDSLPPPPLLVIHGGKDTNVPIEEGRALFEAAAEPKRFLEIPKGNHLLSNSKDLKKALKAIKEWHDEAEQKL